MEDRFKPMLKTVKQHENQLSMLLGALVVIVAGVLLLNIFKDGANGQSMTEAEPTVSVKTVAVSDTLPEEVPETLEAEGIEEILAAEPEETITPSQRSVWERASKAILGILGIQKAAEVVNEGAKNSDNEPSQLLEQADGTFMPQNLPQSYTVQQGDHLWGIAEKYYQSGYNWVDIAQENGLINSDALQVGQVLTLPQVRVRVPLEGLKTTTIAKTTPVEIEQVGANTYTVNKGDSLWSISVKTYNDGFQWTKIVAANPELIKDPSIIEPGWELKLPR